MADPTTTLPRAHFVGVSTYRDPEGRFNIRFPSNWAQQTLQDGREGVRFSPVGAGAHTWLAVWVSRLEYDITAEDIEVLAPALRSGLERFEAFALEASDDFVYGNLIKLDRTFTFSEQGVCRKQHLWVIYVGKWQMAVAYQGTTVAEYDHWLAMANYCLQWFKLPEALWFMSDRDLYQPGDRYQKPRVPRGAQGDS